MLAMIIDASDVIVRMIVNFSFYCSKANSHDKEVQKLYEEMEQQIRTEKERIHNEVRHAQSFSVIFRSCIQWKQSGLKEPDKATWNSSELFYEPIRSTRGFSMQVEFVFLLTFVSRFK